jgi:hypothetical protein
MPLPAPMYVYDDIVNTTLQTIAVSGLTNNNFTVVYK